MNGSILHRGVSFDLVGIARGAEMEQSLAEDSRS